MRRTRSGFMAVALASAAVLAACTSDGVSGNPERVGAPESAEPSGSVPPSPPRAGLEFLLADSYEMGETIRVRLRNNGEERYVYNSSYEACNMRYFDGTGRSFIIPPGTHCDLISYERLRPGKTVTLFEWELDECTRDNWGCSEAVPLEPGAYTVVGRFRPEGGGKKVRVEATFEVTSQ